MTLLGDIRQHPDLAKWLDALEAVDPGDHDLVVPEESELLDILLDLLM